MACRGIIKIIFQGITMPKRIEYIDIAKGIGILLVVMGHNDFGLVSPFFYKLIYSFHMPLFFFVSGMLFNKDMAFPILINKRFTSLIKPYITITLLIYFMTLSFTKVNFDIATGRLFKSFYANGHYIDWVQLWFLPHLFALNIFAFSFYRTIKLVKSQKFSWIFLLLSVTIGTTFIGLFWPFTINILGKAITVFGLPLSIDLILVSGFFFVLGCEVHNIIPEKHFGNPWVLIGSISALIGMVLFFPQKIDFNTRFFESLPINTSESILGIIFIIALSKQIERFNKVSSLFQYIGKASLIILIFHVPIQEAIGEKVMHIFNNQSLSYWVAYFIGVSFPLLINKYFIQPNAIVKSWFGYPPNTDANNPIVQPKNS